MLYELLIICVGVCEIIACIYLVKNVIGTYYVINYVSNVCFIFRFAETSLAKLGIPRNLLSKDLVFFI